MRIGGIEAGGTKMVCAVATDDGTLLERVEIPTRTPADTVPEMLGFFKGKGIESLGIGCFGPVDLNPESETYGYITSTPKLAWADYNIVGAFQEALGVPVGFDTDVNGAIMGEAVWGAAKGCRNAIYITVGTGIGVGVCINGEPLHGLVHPEAGTFLWPDKNRIPLRAAVRTMAAVWREWRAALPSKNAGANQADSYRTKKRYGSSRRFIWHRQSQTISCCIRRRRLF